MSGSNLAFEEESVIKCVSQQKSSTLVPVLVKSPVLLSQRPLVVLERCLIWRNTE